MSETLDKIEADLMGAAEAVEALSTDVIQGAGELVIRGEDDLKLASFIIGGIKDLLDEAEGIFKPVAQATDFAHKKAVAAWNKVRNPLKAALAEVKGKVGDHHNEIRIAAEKARRKAEAEERAREEEQRLAAAVQLEEAGHEEAAEILLETPAPIAKPMISTPPPPKTKGMGIGTKYTAVVVDKLALVRHCADSSMAHRMTDLLLMVNQPALNRIASERKEDFILPGCELVVDTTVSSRRRS